MENILKHFQDVEFFNLATVKDQCDICVGAKLGNVSKEEYDRPYKRKTLGQEERKRDKEESDANTEVWTMDLQSVLTCPKTKVSALYSKTKLTVHNMTHFNLKNKQACNFVFDETTADLSSITFTFLHHQHFKRQLELLPEIKRSSSGAMGVAAKISVPRSEIPWLSSHLKQSLSLSKNFSCRVTHKWSTTPSTVL
ncbi:formation of crista junctions protein 1 [Plakobranchus ocellatus]|uniref:Formation of crista junctions protein 1 n=1 Tax=Plakobranchus ocellatus TaxID=259542 RepID=A0AAV4A2H7_9GAST|nr:formation of crista junctions protein 1 [Plakobranchus ocellatus]